MVWIILGGVAVALAVWDAWRRYLGSGVVCRVEVRQDVNGPSWRWFAFDGFGSTRASCNPRRFLSAPMAADDARFVFPAARVAVVQRGRS